MHNKLLLSKVKLEEHSAEKEKKEALIEKYVKESGDISKGLSEKNEELTQAKVNSAKLKAEKENIVKSMDT